MEPNKILKSHLLDLIFDDRNKAYGAYELRVTYPQRIKRSLLITLGIGAMIVTGVAWTTAGKSKEKQEKFIGKEFNPEIINDKDPAPLPPPRRQNKHQHRCRYKRKNFLFRPSMMMIKCLMRRWM